MVENFKVGAAIKIASTFTAEPIQPALEFVLKQAGLPFTAKFAPYNQVLQELIASGSTLSVGEGVNLIFIRFEDFVRDVSDLVAARALISSTADEMIAALNSFTRRCKTPTILAIFDPSPSARHELLDAVEAANSQLRANAVSMSGITLLTSDDIDLVGSGERYDQESDELAHIPFTENHFAAIALAVARKVHSLHIPDRKVLVLDCDNTIWRGIVGEDGVDTITVPRAFAALQKFAVAVQKNGVLICLASKNSEHDVLDVFKSRSDMVLKLEDIVDHRINWLPKPQNLISLSRNLNLGLDSFVFIDDNPVECELMRLELPQVLTLLLPPDDKIESFLSHLWVFDKVAVTEEDARRTSMYKEDVARKQLENDAVDISDFVASLKVQVDIGSPDETEWPRLAQLTQRTNQFNFTTMRRSESELRTLQRDELSILDSVLRVRVKDRFGDYGLVGLVVTRSSHHELLVDTFLLSCRVLGRGVEHAILRYLGEIAKQKGLLQVLLPFRRTARNEPAMAFAESVVSKYGSGQDESRTYQIPTDVARAILHRPGEDPEAVIEARNSVTKTAPPPSSTADLSERYTALSCKFQTGQSVLAAAAKANVRSRDLPSLPVPPADSREREMLEIWCEVLGIDDLGVEDDYASSGGTSLLATKLIAGIAQRFGVRWPLTVILEHSTVRKLTALLGSQHVSSGSLIKLKPNGTKNVFFVHDGDGETLLYMNIARRLPADLAVFGIEPLQRQHIPLAHSRIEDMATHCIDMIRQRQQHGPFVLGGMCAGGVIAYEMARQLELLGEQVELVIILDAAKPGTAKRQGRIAKQRMGRLAELFNDRENKRSSIQIASATLRKLASATMWEINSRASRHSVRIRFRLLQALLNLNRSWPRIVPDLSIRQIYDSAESNYVPRPSSVPMLLVRASSGQGGDTPFSEIYIDQTLGWSDVTSNLSIEDVDGGHFSMLQEPFADKVAQVISDRLNAKSHSATVLLKASAA